MDEMIYEQDGQRACRERNMHIREYGGCCKANGKRTEKTILKYFIGSYSFSSATDHNAGDDSPHFFVPVKKD